MYGDLLERLKGPFLYSAAKAGRLEECETLIELGANVNFKKEDSNGENEDEYSPLMIATRNGHMDIVRLLLANGADTQLLSKEENTVLHIAASIGDENLCSIFLENNCSPYTLNIHGQTPIDVAAEKGFFILKEWLKNEYENKNDAAVSRIMRNSLEIINTHYGQNNSSNEHRLSDLSTSFRNIKTPDLYNGLFDSSLTENADVEFNQENEESESKSSQLSEENDSYHSAENTRKTSQLLHSNSESDSEKNDKSNDNIHACSRAKCMNAILIARELARKAEELLASSESKRYRLNMEYHALKKDLESILGNNLRGKTVKELEEIEKKLTEALYLVKEEKDKVTQELLQNEEKKHSCIICQSEQKSVLLMPCRHMCVCKHCSTHEELRRCPLCREIILQKIDVFS